MKRGRYSAQSEGLVRDGLVFVKGIELPNEGISRS
jgi:hypothetical protein